MRQSISIFAISILGATAPERWMDLTDMEREASIRQLAPEPLRERLLQVSEKFLGTPYAPSPLGESQGKDADPLIRFDAVDCLTFVEETLAISFAIEPREVEAILIDLRYAEEVAYLRSIRIASTSRGSNAKLIAKVSSTKVKQSTASNRIRGSASFP